MALVALAEEGDLSALVPFFKVSRPLKEAASATLELGFGYSRCIADCIG